MEELVDKNQICDNRTRQYFEEVMAWQNRIFPEYKKEMQGIEWGLLFNKYNFYAK